MVKDFTFFPANDTADSSVGVGATGADSGVYSRPEPYSLNDPSFNTAPEAAPAMTVLTPALSFSTASAPISPNESPIPPLLSMSELLS